MNENYPSHEAGGAVAEIDLPLQPIPIPIRLTVSGLYQWRPPIVIHPPQIPPPIPVPIPHPDPGPQVEAPEAADAALTPLPPFLLRREELRLDVDRTYAQMTVSGTSFLGLSERVHWIASLTPAGVRRWVGRIWYRNGQTALMPYTAVTVQAVASLFPSQRSAKVTFSGGGATPITRTYAYVSPYFHPVEFEFDRVANAVAVTEIKTCAHPNRPAGLPCETLSIDTVYRRAGFDVKSSGGSGVIPVSGAGANGTWSDAEMHDAMQVYWSRFANKAQWAMWVLFAARHDMGSSLGGIMFDSIGPNHRQGTAMFSDSFIAQAPAGDPAAAAWVERMRFWTACHEMGHAFNLAHSWQKALGTPWIPLVNEPEARSFMNYPYRVAGGQAKFFADFEFRFSNPELLFMRHAPARFVQMGNADWFDHHGFEQAETELEPTLRLELRANRNQARFEFLEPAMLELKLTNVSDEPQIVDRHLLTNSEALTVILKRAGRPARQWVPFARYCRKSEPTVLAPGASLYESLFAAAGRNGWDLAEPGNYTVQVALQRDGADLVSNPLAVRIATPASRDEERLAQDLLTDPVGRILAFDGSQVLDSGIAALQEQVARFPAHRGSLHARIALATPLQRDYRRLAVDGGPTPASAGKSGGSFVTVPARPDVAQQQLQAALFADPDRAAESLGHIDYKYYVDTYSEWLADRGDSATAAACETELGKTLAARQVKPTVLAEIERRASSYAAKAAKPKRG
ncbi:MAG: hypothetical protein SF182_22095 [Deltaproteobacteria bacterium]|nr:hypothetical protein [Deltaproteobacteria bacterium]